MRIPFRIHTKRELINAYKGLHELSSKDAIYYTDAVLLCISELADEYHLGFGHVNQLVKALNCFTFDEYVVKTRMSYILGMQRFWPDIIPDKLAPFFLLIEGRGFSLSPLGVSALSFLQTTLRRAFCEREEFYRLKFGRYGVVERRRRQAKKRFYKELTETEQITVLREYWALPYHNEEAKRARKKKGQELFDRYDMRQIDLLNAVRKFGDAVRSIRRRPDLAPLFPSF